MPPATRDLLLAGADRQTFLYRLQDPRDWPMPKDPIRSRVAFSAAHIVADPLSMLDPTTACAIEWDETMAYRRVLWSYGLAVAEAMDTAQRGMGLDWTNAHELIRRSVAEARACGGRIASGAGTDHLAADRSVELEDVIHAYEEQCAAVEGCGSQIILMASRALAACAKNAEDYYRVYGRILQQVKSPVILHWLGDMFDPGLRGYWGSSDPAQAMQCCLSVIRENHKKVDGIKISLLDKNREIEMRRQLPPGVRMYTGDDFHYDELIAGDDQGHSDALLGIFDPIAPAASGALQALDRGDGAAFAAILKPTIPLSRTIFEAPTFSYKTGVVFLAWLNGYQHHFRMVGGKEGARSIVHLSKVLMLADQAGLLIDPDLAWRRMRLVLEQAGVGF